jgi:purine-nucleoside/S-methyl-5'-thioadenosine phosphorylase / adenosine deaminase
MNSFIVPDWPAPASVRALVTTRAFGNLAETVSDDPEMLAARRQTLRRELPADPLWLKQVHETRCVRVEESFNNVQADASVASSPGHICAVLTADCLPVLLCDDSGTIVAAVHAGWRGLAAGVVEAAVEEMAMPGERLLAWLGPAIGPKVYEVGAEVWAAFTASDPMTQAAFVARPNGKWLCDLYALAWHRLGKLGVTRIYGGDFCTYSDHARFYSYRRDGATGRMASLIWTV